MDVGMQYNKKYVSNSLVNAGRITLREALDSSLSHKEHARQIFIALLTDVATSCGVYGIALQKNCI